MIKRSIITIIGLLISIPMLYAWGRKDHNYFMAWASGGYSQLVHNIEPARDYGSIGGAVGLGYEYHYNDFIFSTGLEFMLYNSRSKLDNYKIDRDVLDSEGYEVVYKYNFYKYREKYIMGTIQIPLLFGGRSDNFYAMGGLKIGVNLFGQSTINSEFETKGWYKQYIDEFENMPNHYYFNGFDANNKSKLDLSFMDVSLSAEIGWFLEDMTKFKRPNPVARISIFCDYGLNNVIDNRYPKGDFLNFPRANPVDIEHNTILQGNTAKGKRVNTLFVVLKQLLC